MTFRKAPRKEDRAAVVYGPDGTTRATETVAFIDRKQQLARRAAITERTEKRERIAAHRQELREAAQ